MHFDYIPVASEFYKGEEAVTKVIKDFIPGLSKTGGTRISKDQIGTSNPLFYFVASGGTENTVLSLQKRRKPEYADDPVYLIVHPSSNSLPAAMEILAKLQQEGNKGRIFYLNGADAVESFQKISDAVRNLEVKRVLRKSRIGCIGQPSDWLVASSPLPVTLKKTWGPEIIPVPTARIQELLSSIRKEDILELKSKLVEGADTILEPSESDIEDVVKVHAALKLTAREENLDALTIRCFDLVLSHKTTGCFALAELIDEGIISGCEGDLNSTVGMYWAKLLTDETPWMANPSYLEEQKNILGLAHCTVPRKMVNSYKLRSHFESGMGLGIQGTMKEEEVTLLRIGGSEMGKLWLAEGRIIKNGQAENLCRTQVEIQLDRGGHVSDLLNNPLGNHVVVIYGRYLQRLREWHDTMI